MSMDSASGGTPAGAGAQPAAAGRAGPRGGPPASGTASQEAVAVVQGAPSACISVQVGLATKAASSEAPAWCSRSRSGLSGTSRRARTSFVSSGGHGSQVGGHASSFPASAAFLTPHAKASSFSGIRAHLSASAWRIGGQEASPSGTGSVAAWSAPSATMFLTMILPRSAAISREGHADHRHARRRAAAGSAITELS